MSGIRDADWSTEAGNTTIGCWLLKATIVLISQFELETGTCLEILKYETSLIRRVNDNQEFNQDPSSVGG